MSTGEQTQLKPHRSGFVYTFGILSFISGFFALVLLISGCGETRKQEEVRMMHDHVVQLRARAIADFSMCDHVPQWRAR